MTFLDISFTPTSLTCLRSARALPQNRVPGQHTHLSTALAAMHGCELVVFIVLGHLTVLVKIRQCPHYTNYLIIIIIIRCSKGEIRLYYLCLSLFLLKFVSENRLCL